MGGGDTFITELNRLHDMTIIRTLALLLVAAVMLICTPAQAQDSDTLTAKQQKVSIMVGEALGSSNDDDKLIKMSSSNPFAKMLLGIKVYELSDEKDDEQMGLKLMVAALSETGEDEDYMLGMLILFKKLNLEPDEFLNFLKSEIKRLQ